MSRWLRKWYISFLEILRFPDYIFRIAIVGAPDCGKTCLLRRFNQEIVWNDREKIDHLQREVNCEGRRILLDVYESLPPQKGLRQALMDFTDVCILCYSVDNPESFELIKSVYGRQARGRCILVANKLDLRTDHAANVMLAARDERPVTDDEGLQLAKELGAFAFIECSAKKNYNIEEVFLLAAYEGLRGEGKLWRLPKYRREILWTPPAPTVINKMQHKFFI